MPKCFTDWVSDNRYRIIRAKAVPYFIKDNYKYGNIDKGFKWEKPLVSNTAQKTNIIDDGNQMTADKEINGKLIKTKNEVKAHIAEYASRNIDRFRGEVIADDTFVSGSLVVLKRSLDDVLDHCGDNPDILQWLLTYTKNSVKDWKHIGWAECQPYPPEHPKYDPKNPTKKKHPEAEFFNYYKLKINGNTYYASVKMHRAMKAEVLYAITKRLEYNINHGVRGK